MTAKLITSASSEPGDPEHFYAPDYIAAEAARRQGVPIHKMLSPYFAGSVHALDSVGAIRDLSYCLGGRGIMPRKEIVLIGPDGKTPIVIPGCGVTEAAELEEIAEAAWEKQEKRLREGQEAVDFDALRERAGLPSRKEFDPLFRQALRDRIAKHSANSRTDPAREPIKPRGLIPVAKPREKRQEAEVA